jgi:virulence factor
VRRHTLKDYTFMLRIGIIGLGDIATKAYLPLIGVKPGLTIHLCSRNAEKSRQLADQYRIRHVHQTIDELIEAGIQAAFVHAASVAHFSIVEKLLTAGIAVFVDKPLTLHLAESEKLVRLANESNTLLMVGFNRRYAPVYQQLKAVPEPTMILMQKNRPRLPADIRSFILDDFIHVVDTVRWLFPYPIANHHVTAMREDDQLTQVTLQLTAPEGQTAIASMNRNTAVQEERLEIMSPGEKRVALNVSQLITETVSGSAYARSNDWEPTLQKRGFVAMVDDFLSAVAERTKPFIDLDDALQTHALCEAIINTIEKAGIPVNSPVE